MIGVRRDDGRDGRDAGDVVESRAVGQDHSMTADGVIVVDNSGSQSLCKAVYVAQCRMVLTVKGV